ncbi:MAG: TIGR00269 family protein [Candidatus Syntrophoarchaeum sp.]|nr:TIGR00269 family protein [Candidatus Syntrophoarchaeum sp.]
MIRCDKCSNDAVIYQRYAGMHLCENHFKADVVRKIKKTIRKYGMVKSGDKIAVALSGGKDSFLLLKILHEIITPRRDVELFVISVDEGIAGYRDELLSEAQRFVERMGLFHKTGTFAEKIGITMDEIVKQNFREAPCSFCGVFRKMITNKIAREMGATKVATGHNLDDEAQSVLMNYLKGDINRLSRLMPKRPIEGLIPRIKPLREIPEREITLFGILEGFPISVRDCPYSRRAFRSDMRKVLNILEDDHPGISYSLMRGFEKVRDVLPDSREDIKECEVCGEPSSGNICKMCEFRSRCRVHQFMS